MTDTSPHTIHALELGHMGNFIYIIHDHATDRAAVVDPAWDPSAILALTQQHGLRISDILLTHSHFDHINGVEALLKVSDAQLHLLRAEATFWDRYLDLPTLHEGGDQIRLGETVIDILHTPGHNYGITPTSTWLEQLAGNPFLHCADKSGFVNYRMRLHDREEPYRPEPRPHRHPH